MPTACVLIELHQDTRICYHIKILFISKGIATQNSIY